MTSPLVSFCVPTYGRARYLRSLLGTLADHLPAFPYPYEVVVSDNASPDETPEVLAEFSDRLPMRVFRQPENIGGNANWHFVMGEARGTYVVYVADDDAIIADRVAQAVAAMEANPRVAVAYAPWLLFDLVADQPLGNFYSQDRDILVARDDHRGLLDALLRHGAFPEVYICRRDVLGRVKPRVSEQAFYAFVHAAEFLQHGDVLMMKDPFYVSITRYFADEQRTQAGLGEAEHAWDRYRGGLEYVLGRASAGMSESERVGWCLRIQDLIAERIAVAVRLRAAAGRDAVDTYYLAYRLKAMGRQSLLHVPLDVLRSGAAIDFLLRDEQMNRSVRQLLVQGGFDASVREYVTARAKVPVTFVDQPLPAEQLGAMRDTLVLSRADVPVADPDALARLEAANVRVVSERELMGKFVA
jgi:hypothetical protein